MEVTRMTKRSNYEEITEQIKQQIINGRLKPGQKLPSTRQLSEQFAVGRSTMREALSALKAMGLIDIRQGEGCTVRQLDAEDLNISLPVELLGKETILELLEARKALEISNAALAAEKRTSQDLAQFERILRRMSEAHGDEKVGEETDVSFHLALAEATHNSIIVRLLRVISEQMERAIQETRRVYMYADKDVSEQLWREHQAIYEAVREQNGLEAKKSMEQHLLHVEQVITRFLQ